MKHIAVAGGSLAAVSAARALRSRGFDGTVTVVSGETRPPYDRPPLSKTFLAGTSTEPELALLGDDEDLAIDWRSGVTAVRLRASSAGIELSDGTELTVDGVVLATGARPRLPWPVVPGGVHVLRTLDDALALRQELVPGARLVVVGAGFIGAEVASTAHSLGLDVTVVEAATTPLSGPLGTELGAAVAGLHCDHGVRMLTGVGVTGFLGGHRVAAVRLADGQDLPADVVVLGVGVQPNVEWLAGAGLHLSNGVPCNAYGVTDIPNVVAAGDCATWYDHELTDHHRLEHWTGARERAVIAVDSLLSAGAVRTEGRPPYFWSDQYGVRLQLAGRTFGTDSISIEEGSLDSREFVAVYRRGGEPTAVLALGLSHAFMRWRKQLAGRAPTQPAASAPVLAPTP